MVRNFHEVLASAREERILDSKVEKILRNNVVNRNIDIDCAAMILGALDETERSGRQKSEPWAVALLIFNAVNSDKTEVMPF